MSNDKKLATCIFINTVKDHILNIISQFSKNPDELWINFNMQFKLAAINLQMT